MPYDDEKDIEENVKPIVELARDQLVNDHRFESALTQPDECEEAENLTAGGDTEADDDQNLRAERRMDRWLRLAEANTTSRVDEIAEAVDTHRHVQAVSDRCSEHMGELLLLLLLLLSR